MRDREIIRGREINRNRYNKGKEREGRGKMKESELGGERKN